MNGQAASSKKLFQKCFSSMLITFSIDPEALIDGCTDLSASVACHRRVIQEWRRHGLLIHSHGALKNSLLVSVVEKLPQECRKLWQTAIATTRRRPASVPWDGAFPNEALTELAPLSTEFILALLDPTRAQAVCGLDTHESSRLESRLNDMELCKFHSVCESIHFVQAQDLAMRPLSRGDNCGAEWSRRYSSHLKNSDHVVVVDRYILANHMRRFSNGEISGLTRLLNDCFSKPRDKQVNVKLLCAVQNKSKTLSLDDIRLIEAFVHNLATRYSNGGIRELECFVVKDSDFSDHAHARFFRTGYLVFGIDRGLDSFGGFTADRDTFVWRNDTSATTYFSQQEAALQTKAVRQFRVIGKTV
jgi:hypothetical protein